MAQYKVPQDVEADDKLLGPFSFRQFVYLLIAGILVAVAVGLFQIFPLLAIIPLPPVLLLVALALPLKKDQPMETYLAAVASYYLKPRKRLWMPGQRESTITITAPKIVEDDKTRDITGEEATHRLSFLADIVDTEGYAIKGGMNHVNTALAAEAAGMQDMFEASNFGNLENTIVQDENERHAEVVQEMREKIMQEAEPTIETIITEKERENVAVPEEPVEKSEEVEQKLVEKEETKPTNPSIIELANNTDYSVATIAKEANRIKEREEGEVFISLH
ncbi:PrgI family protein [Candidatus Saccharibacteria bacterium]|nr:PrgI family protein [Candidatus Saccharibacteria bacterium]